MIELGMSRERTNTVLSNGALTKLNESTSQNPEIRFRDYWRTYRINFDPVTGEVRGKYFYFNRRQNLLGAFLKLIGSS